MGWVLLSARQLYLTQRINDLEYRQIQLQQKLMDLHKIGSFMADGKLNYGEMAGMPLGLIPYANRFVLTQQIPAYGRAKARTNFLYRQWVEQSGKQGISLDDQTKAEGYNYYFEQAYEAQMAEVRKAQEAEMKVKEDAIQMELTKIKTQIDATNKELEKMNDGITKGMDRTTPKYA